MATFEIPETCKAGVVVSPIYSTTSCCVHISHANNKQQVNYGPDFHLEVQDVPVPKPGPGQLLIKLNVTGLCGSDIHFMANDLGNPVGE